MPAYIYGDIDITDPEGYETYRAQAPALIAAHGGRYLVRGGVVEALEGGPDPKRQVILEFPDMAALKAFYFSPEYTALKVIRQRCSTGTFVVIEGV